MSVWNAVAAGIGGAFGLAAGDDAADSQKATNATQIFLAGKSRRWQKRLSSNAVYRRMNDMRRAGINPILAAKYDATTPAGAMAQLTSPGMAQAAGMNAGANLVNSAVGAASTMANINKVKAETVRILGQTSYGQDIINQLGGAEALAEKLASNETLNQAVKDVMDKALPGWEDRVMELVEDPSILDYEDPNHIDMRDKARDGTDRRRGWEYREHKDDVNRYKPRYGLQFHGANSEN